MNLKQFTNISFYYLHLYKLIIYILYVFTYIEYSIYSVYNFVNKKIIKYYDNHFDKEIFEIVYIDGNGKKFNIYNILNDLIYFTECLFYDINNENKKFKNINSLNRIHYLLENNTTGLIIVDIYNNQKHNKIIINLEYFYANIEINNLISILNIIYTFLLHKINEKIIHIQIDNDGENVNITDDFFLYDSSYYNNNITTQDLINVINIIKYKNYNEYKNIKLTDTDLNDIIYENDRYLNL